MKTLPHKHAVLASRLPLQPHSGPGRSTIRLAVTPWRAWYHSQRWRRLRWKVLTRDLFTCRMCGRLNESRNLVCDHIRPHHGEEALFWDEVNLQTLCADPCHNTHKQQQEQGQWEPPA